MKSRFLKGISCLLACVMLLEATLLYFTKDVYSNENVIALRKEAVKWIEKSQNEDGSWGKSLGTYSTTEVLKHAGKQNLSGDVREKAVNYLKAAHENSNDDLYRKNSINEITTEDKINEMIKEQNGDGSFGISEEYEGDTLDTLLALEAMLESEVLNKKAMEKAVSYVLSNQNEDGSFSYTGNAEGNTCITARAAIALKKYIRENGGSENEKVALNSANEYLLLKEKEISGKDDEALMEALMITIALTESDADMTLKRLEKTGNEIQQDGSINEDACLTAMYVNAIDEYLTFVKDETGLTGPEITGLTVSADEDITAYTKIMVDPEIIGINNERHEVSVCMGNENTAYVKGTADADGYELNTENMEPGKYYIVSMVTDRESGQVVAIKRKQVEISEGIKIFKSVLNYSPKSVSVNTKKEIKFKLRAETGINTNTDIDININVENQNGENVYEDNRSIEADANTKYIECNDFSFMSQANTADLYTVTVRYKNKNTVIKTDRALIKVFDEENENRVDIKYEADKDEINDDDKYVNVKFDMQGIGLSENIKRRPMDIVIILDNSASMGDKDWKNAVEGAKIITNYIQPEDRVLIRYINLNNPACKFISDKKSLNQVLDNVNKNINYWGGTPIYSSINNSINDFKNSENRDKVIYLFSDGERSADSRTLNVKQITEQNITIYSVFLESNASESSRAEAKKTMQYIADISDGVALTAPTNEEIADCVAALANDIFMIAGKDIELGMRLNKDINPDDIEFSNAPDEIIKNDDGTNTLLFKQGYLSVGQDNNMEMKVPVTGIADDEIINLMDEITLSYINENDEKVELKPDPLTVKRKITTEIVETEPETKQSTEETVDKKTTYAKNVLPKESDGQGRAVKGSISVDNTDMETGDTAKISCVIENKGQEKENGILKVSAINIKNKNVTELENKEAEIGKGEKITETIETDTSLLGEGNFLIIYQFVTDDEVILMDEAGLKLTDHAYKFKIQCTDGGSIISEPNDAYKEGQSISLEAVADEGYIFAGWECDYGAFSDRYDKSTIFTMPGSDVTVRAVFVKRKSTENAGSSISESVTKDDSGENPGNEITTQKAVKKDGNSNVKGRAERNSTATKKNHNKNVNISGKHKKGYGKNDSIKKNSDGIKTYNVDENNQNNKEIKSGSPVKTGDFETRKTIAALMIIQFISIIVIIFMTGKKEKKNNRG